MAVLRRPYARARRLARELLWECGVDEPSKIDPLLIVGRRKIIVIYGKLDGATAQILRQGERAIIRVSDQIVQIGRRRFTIAHELGHYLLGHRIPTEMELGTTAPFSAHQEREADLFAVEFLMPEAWVAPMCRVAPSFAAIHAIAKTFQMSIVASAMRYVEFSAARCAIVYSEGGNVVWAKRSRTFPGRIPAQLRIGAGAIACGVHERPIAEGAARAARAVPASAWFGNYVPATIGSSLVEQVEVVPEPGWGGVLSLLSQGEHEPVIRPSATQR
jgi:Zn-dependent peptidase ImmA (M78 family)